MSESQESVYLYAKESRENYLEVFTQKKCPHLFKVLPFLDSDKENRQEDDFFSLHLQTCECCKNQALKIMDQFKRVDQLIPEIPLSAQTRSEIERFHHRLIAGTTWDVSWSHKVNNVFFDQVLPGVADFFSVFKKPIVIVAILAAGAFIYL